MDNFLKAIGALNDETRIIFLKFLLINGRSCVCEFEESFSMLQPRISRHLKILKDAGFLTQHKEGKRVFYQINTTSSTHKTLLKEIEKLDIDLPKKICSCDIKKVS